MSTSVSTPSGASAPGTTCRGCERRLPLRSSTGDERALLWECVACNTPFAGILLVDALDEIAARIRMAEVHFETQKGKQISRELREFVERFEAARVAEDNRFKNRRRSPRVAQDIDVVAVGVDLECDLVGSPLQAMVANLSSNGILLVSDSPVESPRVFVRIPFGNEWLQVLGRVVWSRVLSEGFHGAGIEFIARLGNQKIT